MSPAVKKLPLCHGFSIIKDPIIQYGRVHFSYNKEVNNMVTYPIQEYNEGAWIPINRDNEYIDAEYSFTTSVEEIAGCENPVFGTSKEDAVKQIRILHPLPDNIMNPCITNLDTSHWNDTIYVKKDYMIVESEAFGEIDIDELIKLMPTLGSIDFNNSNIDNLLSQRRVYSSSYGKLKLPPNTTELRQKLRDAGIYVKYNFLHYDNSPKKTKAKKSFTSFKRGLSNKKWHQKQLQMTDIKELLWNLNLSNIKIPGTNFLTIGDRVEWYNAETKIFISIDLFNNFYGKNAHRRHKNFIQFKTLWKSSTANTLKNFSTVFKKFMVKELNAPNYKAKTGFEPVAGLRSCWAAEELKKEKALEV
jgi:hypothetical protein